MDIVCFYIISCIIFNYTTTVYRIYGAKRVSIAVSITVRIEHIVVVHVAVIHIAHVEVSIARVAINAARRQPLSTPSKGQLAHHQLCPSFIDFFQPTIYFMISSIASPNFIYLF